MFVSKKKYEEKLDIIEAFRIERDHNKTKIYDLQVEKSNLINMNEILENRIKNLEYCNDSLFKKNQKLIEWVEKIINEVGVYEVRERNTFSIPVYKRDDDMCFNNGELLEWQLPITKKEVIIPEIRILQMGRK